MDEGEKLHAIQQRRLEGQRAVVRNGNEAQFRASAFGEELPRDEVAVVLHFGEQNHIACAEIANAPSVRNEVDGLGSSACEDDFLRLRRAEIFRNFCACALESIGRARTQFVQSAMHVGVVALVVVRERGDDGARLLRAGGIIEIDERISVHLVVENRKVSAHFHPIVVCHRTHHVIARAPWQRRDTISYSTLFHVAKVKRDFD